MFNSGISAYDLIDQLQQEADVAIPIPETSYYEWLNELQYLLYTEIIREISLQHYTELTDQEIDIESAEVTGESPIRFEDVLAVYAEILDGGDTKHVQLTRMTPLNGSIFPYSYYKNRSKIKLHIPEKPNQTLQKITIAYYTKPEAVTKMNAKTAMVAVPAEFISLVKSKLRGEAYKLCNEGTLAANWISDYNVLLETFRKWIESRREAIGI